MSQMSGGQEIEFHEIKIIILLNRSGDQKGPRGRRGALFQVVFSNLI
jgi:hypothetical protein